MIICPWCRWFCPTAWEDFHPDGLLERLPGLSILVEALRLVHDPAAMQQCLEEAGVAASVATHPATADGGQATQPAPNPSIAPVSDGDLLDSMLADDGASAQAAPSLGRPPRDALDQLVRGRADGDALGPHRTPILVGLVDHVEAVQLGVEHGREVAGVIEGHQGQGGEISWKQDSIESDRHEASLTSVSVDPTSREW